MFRFPVPACLMPLKLSLAVSPPLSFPLSVSIPLLFLFSLSLPKFNLLVHVAFPFPLSLSHSCSF